MSYAALADLAHDDDFRQRVAACLATEPGTPAQPHVLAQADAVLWRVAAAPGFADAYAYAQATDVQRPGRAPEVISDAQILAAVQALD